MKTEKEKLFSGEDRGERFDRVNEGESDRCLIPEFKEWFDIFGNKLFGFLPLGVGREGRHRSWITNQNVSDTRRWKDDVASDGRTSGFTWQRVRGETGGVTLSLFNVCKWWLLNVRLQEAVFAFKGK